MSSKIKKYLDMIAVRKEFENDGPYMIDDNPSASGNSNSKYAMLAEQGIIGVIKTQSGIIYFTKGHPDCKFTTYAFRLPVLRGNPETDRKFRLKLSGLKKFCDRWILKKKTAAVTVVEYVRVFTLYTPNHCLISIMQFDKLELEKDLKKNEIKYDIVSPDTRTIECPICESPVDVNDNDKLGQCPECDREFVIQ